MQLMGKKQTIFFNKKETDQLFYRLGLLKYSRYSYIQNIGFIILNHQDENKEQIKLNLPLMLKTDTQLLKFLFHMFAIDSFIDKYIEKDNNEKLTDYLRKFKKYININFLKRHKSNYDLFYKEYIYKPTNLYSKINEHIFIKLNKNLIRKK